MKIGFIGMGNMGRALLKGALNFVNKDDLCFSANSDETKNKISGETGVSAMTNIEVAKQSDVIFLTVKPNIYDEVLDEIKDEIDDKKILISVAPGVMISYFENRIPGVRVIRTMPNTPAMIGEGVTAITYDKNKFSDDEIKSVTDIFNACGSVYYLDESLMDVSIPASGSSPAFVYMFIDYMARSCEKMGMDYETAKNMAASTLRGAAGMVLNSDESPDKLKDRVCSKGGTTIEGVRVIENSDFENIIDDALNAAYKRAVEMRRE